MVREILLLGNPALYKKSEPEMVLEGSLAELIQHEYDHLDGILATMRAVDEKLFVMRHPYQL